MPAELPSPGSIVAGMYPPGELPNYILLPEAIKSMAHVPPLVHTAGPGEPGQQGDAWLLEDNDNLEIQDAVNRDWEKETTALIQYFCMPDSMQFTGSYLHEILEECQFLADDVSEQLLALIGPLGQCPPGIVNWPWPNNDDCKECMDKTMDFLAISSKEPYFEQSHISSKQYFIYELLSLYPLQQLYTHLNVPWQRCKNLVNEWINQTAAFVDATNMELGQMETCQCYALACTIMQVLPNCSSHDWACAEREAN
ncbi:hypothetical protein DACRYDRAFT_13391 [Dacryopinax primogenitus]|uniref:Uncharacterized protein n=1 Tax=Dacryopinax primogenitus (strain DJM 731) TaxID=1858805 RepID=M5G985_DACPD|nr:uncharacterized protein DACRYDRAFT_13391 [Dacryopinax primogenitus]EJU05329.1 hypothetical protein DACRYDRAFT_13391 [Dacryopinax primogenitus]